MPTALPIGLHWLKKPAIDVGVTWGFLGKRSARQGIVKESLLKYAEERKACAAAKLASSFLARRERQMVHALGSKRKFGYSAGFLSDNDNKSSDSSYGSD